MEEIPETPSSHWAENLRKVGIALSYIGLGTLAVNDVFLVLPDMLGIIDADSTYQPVAFTATAIASAGVALSCVGLSRPNNH
ncbi:MAG TPA: hypothetical protein PKB09_03315 [Candidatus Saccharibacteria bacterium]|nr:hypothetical protein [Candidatus Saccharibacteria bacterium]